MSSRRQIIIPLGVRYKQVPLYLLIVIPNPEEWTFVKLDKKFNPSFNTTHLKISAILFRANLVFRKSKLTVKCQDISNIDYQLTKNTFEKLYICYSWITHLGRVTHICDGDLTIIGPDNGLWPGRRQAIIWTNAGILLIGPWGTNFSEILVGIQTFSFKKIHLKMLSAK